MKTREIRSWLMDMDGVLVREEQPIPGAAEVLTRLRERGLPFLVLTNNSMYTRRDLAARLAANGLHVPEDAIWTSALATFSSSRHKDRGLSLRDRRVGSDERAPLGRVHVDGARSGLRRARGNAHL